MFLFNDESNLLSLYIYVYIYKYILMTVCSV